MSPPECPIELSCKSGWRSRKNAAAASKATLVFDVNMNARSTATHIRSLLFRLRGEMCEHLLHFLVEVLGVLIWIVGKCVAG